MSKPKYTIAVTGLNAIDSPGPGISVIRSLREAKSFDVRIIGLSYESLEPGIYMRDLVDKTYQIPYPSAGTDILLERLEHIHSIETLHFIFPNFDAELFNFIMLNKRLNTMYGIKMFLPSQEAFEARQKVNLYEYGKKHNINVPFSKTLNNSQDFLKLDSKELSFPLVVKGKYYDAYIAYSPTEAVQYYNKLNAKWGLPILAQEFITGSEVNVCGIGDGQGNTIGAVPMRKLYITDKGKAWSGITIDSPKLLEITRNLVKATKWNGPFELELVKTSKEEYYLIEINPRFPAWCYLTVGAGQNQAEALINLGMGQPVTPFASYDIGKIFIRYSYDMVVNMSDFEQLATKGEF